MKISKAFRHAGRVFAGQMGAAMKLLLLEACLTLFCFAPALFWWKEDLRLLMLLCVPLILLVLLPARMNAAVVMGEALAGGSLFTRGLVDLSGYGEKLRRALIRGFFLLLWSAPMIASFFVIREHVAGQMDGFTLMRMVRSTFGGGNLFTGVMVIGLIVLATVLLAVFGCAFHSGARHAWAQGAPERVNGHHGRVVGTWFASLASVLPILIALLIVILRYLPVLRDLNGLFMGTLKLPATRGTLIILGVGAVLTLPLLPLRSLIIAAGVRGLAAEKESEKA